MFVACGIWCLAGVSSVRTYFRTGQKSILLSCPQCLDSMLAPGFMNLVYKSRFTGH